MLQVSFKDFSVLSAVGFSISGDEIPGFHDSSAGKDFRCHQKRFSNNMRCPGHCICNHPYFIGQGASRRTEPICAGYSSGTLWSNRGHIRSTHDPLIYTRSPKGESFGKAYPLFFQFLTSDLLLILPHSMKG